jgi:hypothetical protein
VLPYLILKVHFIIHDLPTLTILYLSLLIQSRNLDLKLFFSICRVSFVFHKEYGAKEDNQRLIQVHSCLSSEGAVIFQPLACEDQYGLVKKGGYFIDRQQFHNLFDGLTSTVHGGIIKALEDKLKEF